MASTNLLTQAVTQEIQQRLGYHTISWATEASSQAFTICAESTAPATDGPFYNACPHEARYIKIELPGTDRTLNLAEVEVYGKPSCAREGANPGSQVTARSLCSTPASVRAKRKGA